MEKIIVVIMHGITPKDFPQEEKREYMKLRAKYHDTEVNSEHAQSVRFHELEAKIRNWPRNQQNDPFFVASEKLGKDLEEVTGSKVLVGFNEFCAPSASHVLTEATHQGAKEVIVTTPMLTRGGHHSEEEIPELIQDAQERHPETTFRYAWPFDSLQIARFLAAHIEKFEKAGIHKLN